jgi:hypothetical protein
VQTKILSSSFSHSITGENPVLNSPKAENRLKHNPASRKTTIPTHSIKPVLIPVQKLYKTLRTSKLK